MTQPNPNLRFRSAVVVLTELLPLQASLFAEEFALEQWEMDFAHEYLRNGESALSAYLVVKPHVTANTAKSESCRLLKRDEVKRYLAWRRTQMALRAQLTEDELIAGARRVYLHGVGDLPMRKTLVSRYLGTKEVEVRDPNLGAANTAIETLRKLGGFGKDLSAPSGAVVFSLNLAGDGEPAQPPAAGADDA